MRRLLLAWLLRAAAIALLPPAGADVVFRVPEVMVRPISGAKSVGIGPSNASRSNDSKRWSEPDVVVQYEEYFVEHEVSTADAREAAALLKLEDATITPHKRSTEVVIFDILGACADTCAKSRQQQCVQLITDQAAIVVGQQPVTQPMCLMSLECAAQPARPALPGIWNEIQYYSSVPATLAGCGVCSQRDMEYCETRVLADHCCCERQFIREPFPWLPHTCYVGPHRCRPLAHDCVRYVRLRNCCCYKKLAERWKSILSSSSRVGASGASLLLLLLPLLPLAARL